MTDASAFMHTTMLLTPQHTQQPCSMHACTTTQAPAPAHHHQLQGCITRLVACSVPTTSFPAISPGTNDSARRSPLSYAPHLLAPPYPAAVQQSMHAPAAIEARQSTASQCITGPTHRQHSTAHADWTAACHAGRMDACHHHQCRRQGALDRGRLLLLGALWWLQRWRTISPGPTSLLRAVCATRARIDTTRSS